MKKVLKPSRKLVAFFLPIFVFGSFAIPLPSYAQEKAAEGKKAKQKLIRIGRETTRVLGPLDDEGFVDYVGALNEIQSNGVTKDNNGAAEFWQAIGSGPIPLNHREDFFKVLGIDVPPANGMSLSWGEYARGELKLPNQVAATVEAMLVNARKRPWKRGEFPQVASWIDAQQGRFKLLAVAVRKDRFYQPLIIAPGAPLVQAELPGAMMAREMARSLQARAMLRTGEGDWNAAHDDIETLRRLARHLGAGSTILHNLVGIAIESMACQGFVNLVQHQQPAPNEVPKLLARFDTPGPMPKMTASLNLGERFLFLETAQNLARHGAKEAGMPGLAGNPVMATLLRSMVDWNVPMQDANEYYDRLVEIGEIESITKRRNSAIIFETEMEDYLRNNARPSPFKLLTGKGRGKAVGNVLKALLLPAIHSALDAEHRIHDYQNLCRLATALEGYRTQHGKYPDTLEKLVPAYFEKQPLDTFSGEMPFRYESDAETYVVYGLSHNTIDDGGVRDADLVVQGPLDWEGIVAARRAREQADE
jgi:hypothetical protein